MAASKTLPTFEVDKAGMAMVFARKGKAFVVTELLQNAWDENTTRVDVTLEWLGNGKARLVVQDDNPDGFADLRHAYTLFAESAKKSDPTKRGRFNLGEKLVIAICDTACIETTRGTVLFDGKGRQMLTKKRKSGSVFTGVLRMTKAEVDEVTTVVGTLIPPPHIVTTFNLTDVPVRPVAIKAEATLRTEMSDAEGRLKPTTRKTVVELYDPIPGEVATIYEMGIPVVETGDRYHVNVMQKIPLNTDRDNVTPAYLRDVRVTALNAAHSLMAAADMEASWVIDALQDDNVEPEAVKAAIKGKFGDMTVISDPTDQEANNLAVSAGYTLIPGGALPKAAWANVKGAGASLPAGQVTPSDPSPGDEHSFINPAHYTDECARVVAFTAQLALEITGAEVVVRICNDPLKPFRACYAPSRDGRTGRLSYNVGRLGYKFFSPDNREDILSLMIHELGHHYDGNHLSHQYLDALTMLAGRAVQRALEDPTMFEIDQYDADVVRGQVVA